MIHRFLYTIHLDTIMFDALIKTYPFWSCVEYSNYIRDYSTDIFRRPFITIIRDDLQ